MESILFQSPEEMQLFLVELAIPNQSSKLTKTLESNLKNMYDNSVSITKKKFGVFDSLIVDNLDPDSIWEEISSRCDPLSKYLDKKLSTIQARLNVSEIHDKGDEDGGREQNPYYSEDEVEDDVLDGDMNDGADDDDDDVDDDNNEYDFDYANDGGEQDQIDEEEEEGGEEKVVYDDNESDMEEYLDQMERDEMTREAKLMRKDSMVRGHKPALEYDDDNDEDDFDYIQRVMYKDEGDEEDDDEEMEDAGGVDGKGIMYTDFFSDGKKINNKNSKIVSEKGKGDKGSKESKPTMFKRGMDFLDKEVDNDEDGDEEDEYYSGNNKQHDDDSDEEDDGDDADFDDENLHDDYQDDDDDDEEEEEAVQNLKKLTKFEKSQLANQKVIKELEKQVTGQKSWDMKGEVKGLERPENSLLEITADIERASKPAPIVTETYTNTIEEMILKRIKDDQFDDIIPKESSDQAAGSLEDDGEGIPDVSQEKSKLGLGEVYANEYLLRAGHQTTTIAAATEAEEVLRKTVKGLFHNICRDLDSLSNFYFTPKPVAVEGAVTTSPAVPTILLEDIAPYRPHNNHSTDTQGPEQIYNKKRGREGELMNMTIDKKELTQEERKRLRRARKEHRHQENLTQKAKDQLIIKGNKNTKEYQNLQNEKTNQILHLDKRVTVGKHSNKNSQQDGGVGSSGGSTHFFEKLQSQVADDIERKSKSLKNKQASSSSSSNNAADFGGSSSSKSTGNSSGNTYKL